MIQEIISERETRRDSVIDEISEKWGQKQMLVGPMLTIPYRFYLVDRDDPDPIKRYVHLLPEKLDVNGSIASAAVIYDVLYNSRMSVSGNFSPLTPGSLGIPLQDFMFDEAFMSVGISDMTGIKESIDKLE